MHISASHGKNVENRLKILAENYTYILHAMYW